MGSHLPLGDRQARLSGVERANIRFRRNSRIRPCNIPGHQKETQNRIQEIVTILRFFAF